MTSGRFHLNGAGAGNGENNSSSSGSNNDRAQVNTNDDDSAAIATTTTTTTSATLNTTNIVEQIEHIRKFVFTSSSRNENLQINCASSSRSSTEEEVILEKLEIKIPELLQGGYSFYTWPCAPILAWFLWERRQDLNGKRILELGAGTALPGILAAKCGAKVTLSDNSILPKSLAHIRKSCLTNNLVPGRDIEIIGLSWGLLLSSVFNIDSIDLIIAADCFYDPTVFEDIIVTVAFLLERNPAAKFLFTYQERSSDWSIESLLKKWKLCAHQVNIDDLGKTAAADGADGGIDPLELMGGHTIHLIEITKIL